MNHVGQLRALLLREPAVLVRVHELQGSGPREVGAWMAVGAQGQLIGTVGGGQLEFDAIAQARALLCRPAAAEDETLRRYPLGPSLGQCCGGVVTLSFARLGAADIAGLEPRLEAGVQRLPVALFGGGHVARAIVKLLGELPVSVQWFDSRDEVFPAELPETVRAEHSDPVQAAVRDVVPGAHVLIMSFSHAEDLEVLAQCLARQRLHADLRSIGLIGSKSKWASFRHRLEARGFASAELDAVICPIGLPEIKGKQPALVALSVVAQLFANSGSSSQ
jgi:xanthine dehydrogenase accessory factor